MPSTEQSFYFHQDLPFINTASSYSHTKLESSLSSLPAKTPQLIIKITFPPFTHNSPTLFHLMSISCKISTLVNSMFSLFVNESSQQTLLVKITVGLI